MGIGITQLKRIYTDLSEFRLGQIVGPPEGLLGWFKFVRYNDGDGIRGIRGMVASYAKPAPANDVNGAGEPGYDTVTVDTSGASNLSAGILVGDSPLGFSNGGVYQNDQYGFIQLSGRPIVDLWMAADAAADIVIVQDDFIVPHADNDGIMDGKVIAHDNNIHSPVGYALANGEPLLNDQSLVTFPLGLTGTARYLIGETVDLSAGTGASGSAVINEIFSSYSGATETQWGMRITGTAMIIATEGNTTYTGLSSSGAQAVALAGIAERIKAVNVRLTLPLS